MSTLFVITHDGGHDGQSAPIQAFWKEEEAIAAAKLMSQSESFRVYAVPVWPAHTGTPWFNLEPIWPRKAA